MELLAVILEFVAVCVAVYWIARGLNWLHWRGVLRRAKRVDREHRKRKG